VNEYEAYLSDSQRWVYPNQDGKLTANRAALLNKDIVLD